VELFKNLHVDHPELLRLFFVKLFYVDTTKEHIVIPISTQMLITYIKYPS
jgi:hypothetical protein